MPSGSGTPTVAEMRSMAERLLAAVHEVSDQAFLVGALRRGQAANEVELVVVPRMLAADLFGDAEPDLRAVSDCVNGWGETVRRPDGTLVCTFRNPAELTHSVRVVVHLLPAGAQVGLAIARLTGPQNFFTLIMKHLNDQGYRIESGGSQLVSSDGKVIAVPDEAALFSLASMQIVSPEDRAEAVLVPPSASSATSRSGVSRNHVEHQGRGMPIERD